MKLLKEVQLSCKESTQALIELILKSFSKVLTQTEWVFVTNTKKLTRNNKETSDTLRGPKVNARKHWDGESWILEDAKTRKPLLIGTSSQILDEYDRRNKSL